MKTELKLAFHAFATFLTQEYLAKGVNNPITLNISTHYIVNGAVEDGAPFEYAELKDVLAGRPDTFIWSDTPYLGVGNSSDTDPTNFSKWANDLVVMLRDRSHDDDDGLTGVPVEIALIEDASIITYISIEWKE